MIISILLALFLSGNPLVAHEFKMSVCEVEYLKEHASYEMRCYLFQDDLKEVLYGDPMAPAVEARTAAEYILGKTKLEVDGQLVVMRFVEMKERADQVQLVFQSQKGAAGPRSGLKIGNRMLVEQFSQQTNMVYLVLPGRGKITHIMNAKKTEVVISL